MPDVTITLTSPQLTRFVDASADIYGYQSLLVDGSPNTQTRAQFARAQLIDHIRRLVKDSETRQAEQTARTTVPDLGGVT